MKFTLDWLSDFVDLTGRDSQEIADALESLGHEVEQMTPIEYPFTGVVIGRVLEVGSHPNADKVRLCRVDIGDEESEIICGAWNFEAGAVVPVAVPGAVLGGDFEITRRTIRGVVSSGMICSEQELQLGEESAGIMVLDDEFPEAIDRVGQSLTVLLPEGDVIYDVAITPNRPDAMSVLGLARDLAALYDVPLRTPAIELEEHHPETTATVTILDAEACPRFAGREVRGIEVGPSPLWMRRRLAAAGVRPISNVVDASNYAMIELGHPTHAFDLDRLGDTVIVRRADAGETVVTLDGQDRDLLPGDIVVADATEPVALAGIMGGLETEVHDDTTRLLIEAAYWDPPSILLTSKRLGLRSEASARFERGMDPSFCALAADRVAQLLVQIAGGRAMAGPVDAYPAVIEPLEIPFPIAEVPRHLGIELDAAEVTSLLERLGFAVAGEDPLLVTIPTRRPDVRRSIDLVEEVGRLHGYDSIPTHVATGQGGGIPAPLRRMRRLRSVMVGAGYHEVVTFSFIGGADMDGLGLPETDARRATIAVTNPLRDEEGVMRTTLLPGLLKAAALNVSRRVLDVALFETGRVFLPGAGKLPEQPTHLGFIRTGRVGVDWEGGGREVDVRDATGLWEVIATDLGINERMRRPAATPEFHPGRAAEVLVAGTAVGVVGEIHPRVAAAFGLTGRVIAGEIETDVLTMDRAPFQLSAPSNFPPAVFDLAFELDAAVPAADVLAAIDDAGADPLETVTIFDVFTGPPLAAGRKSIAVNVTLRAHDRTLTDEEAREVRKRIADRVAAATGGAVRGEV